MSTHHVVLDTLSVKKVLDCCSAAGCRSFIVYACGADCEAAAFGTEAISIFHLSFSLLLIFFSFASCDVGQFFVAQFHSIDVPRRYVMRITSRSRIVFMSSF